LQEGQGIFEEAVLQQAEDVGLGLDRVFRDGKDADVLVIDGDQGVPATRGIVEREAADQRRVELGAAPGRQPGQVEFVDPALEDLRGLLGLRHAAAIFDGRGSRDFRISRPGKPPASDLKREAGAGMA
jgi:hypothetical protein